MPVPVPVCVSGLVTTTFAAPAVPEGVVAVNCVALTNATFVAALPPMLTVAPETKPVPVMVTAWAPAVVPVAGVTPVTIGGAATENMSSTLPRNPPLRGSCTRAG